MKRILLQGVFALLLISGLVTISSPDPIAYASAARPLGTVPGQSPNGPSATYCNGTNPGGFDYYYAFMETNQQLSIVDVGVNYTWFTTTYLDTTPENFSITCFLGRVYAAWRANDSSNSIHVGYDDGTCPLGQECYLKEVTIPGQATMNPPALSVSSNGSIMYAAWRDSRPGNNSFYIEQTTNGTSWYNLTRINQTTYSSPTLTNFQGQLYVAWPGTDNPPHLNWGYYVDKNPNLFNKNTDYNDFTKFPLGISVYNNRLQLAWKGYTNYAVFTGSWAPGGFRGNGSLPGAQSVGTPSLQDQQCFFTDRNFNINQQQIY